MKYCIILLLFLLSSCYNDDIQEIKDELQSQQEILELLKNNVNIIGVDFYDDRYVIKFSDGKSYTLYNGKTPIITIGENGNWFIDGIDSGKTSVGNDGKTPTVEINSEGYWVINGVNTGIVAKGETPVITIGENGNWFIDGIDSGKTSVGNDGKAPTVEINSEGYWVINGVNTGVMAKGENGNNAPYISNVLIQDNTIIFYFSDGSYLSTQFKKTVITIWGDSITWGSAASSNDKCYTAILRKLLNDRDNCFEVINCGVGGESFQNILVRQGALGFYLADDIIIPKSPENKVEIQRSTNWINNKKFKNTWFGDNSYFSLLLQGELGRDNQEDKYRTVNPIIVNGIECTMSIEGTPENNIIYLATNQKLDNDAVIKKGTYLYPHGVTFNSDITVFSIGTNDGFTIKNTESEIDIVASVEQYIDLIDLAIEKSGTSKYIVCSPYGGTILKKIGVDGLSTLEKALAKRYGNKFFNWRQYLIDNGLNDAGLSPTTEDNEAIAIGQVPPSLLADGLHPNDYGHKLIGHYLYKMMYSLGYI